MFRCIFHVSGKCFARFYFENEVFSLIGWLLQTSNILIFEEMQFLMLIFPKLLYALVRCQSLTAFSFYFRLKTEVCKHSFNTKLNVS